MEKQQIELTTEEISVITDALKEYHDTAKVTKWNYKKGSLGRAIEGQKVKKSKPLLRKFEKLAEE